MKDAMFVLLLGSLYLLFCMGVAKFLYVLMEHEDEVPGEEEKKDDKPLNDE